MDEEKKRKELADFLRTRRARITPAEVGLPQMARRKTAGLRREEVAQLASVGVTWYTWLEQGRDIRVSNQVLESVASALHLTADEQAHLFLLAGQAPPPLASTAQEQVSPFLSKFLQQPGANPAYITGRRWDILAWNRAACAILGDFDSVPAHERNIVHFIFTNQEIRRRLVDWEGIAQRVLAQFRASSSQYTDDPQFALLIHELQHRSPEFAHWWSQHDVRGRRDGRKEILHPQVGYLVFENSVFQPSDAPEPKVTIYLPAIEETADKLKQLLAQEETRSSAIHKQT